MRHLTRLNPSSQWFLETRGVDRPRKKRSKRRRGGEVRTVEKQDRRRLANRSKPIGWSAKKDEDEEEGEDIAVRNPERTSRSAVPPYNFDLQRREESNMAADSFYAVNSEPRILHDLSQFPFDRSSCTRSLNSSIYDTSNRIISSRTTKRRIRIAQNERKI